VLLATAASCSALGLLMFAPLYVFGFVPLEDKYPIFIWPFVCGLLSFRIWEWFKFRTTERERDQADMVRKKGLQKSINDEIAERKREQRTSC
jgi:hypothetical protein